MKPFNSFSVLPMNSRVEAEVCHTDTAHSLTINLNSFSNEYDGSTAIHFQFKTEAELNNLVIAINEAFEKEVRK
jgi:hypothetical protein